jgi:hypothetical protein
MPTLTCRTHSYTPCSTQDAIRLRSGVRGQLSVSPRLFTVLSSLCRDTLSFGPCSTQDAIRLRSGVRGQLSVSPRSFTVLSSLCRDTLSFGPCSTQDAIRLHSGVLHDFPSVLFRVTFDAHCLGCGVLEQTHGLCLVTTGHSHQSRLLCAGRGG